MATVTKPFTHTNGTVADATEVNANDDATLTQVNGNLDADNINETGNFVWSGSHSFGSLLKLNSGVLEQGGSRHATWMNNIAIIRATTTNAGDSIKITGANGTALSATNYGWITLPNPSTPGQLVTFSVTADVTILLTGCHWDLGTTGDIIGAILRVLAINDNGTLRWGVAYLGGRHTLLTTNTNATQTNINLAEEVLCTAAVSSATNSCREIGFFRADFDDTGGAAEDLWAIQSGVGDVVTGQSADGLFRPFNPTYSGFSLAPTVLTAIWTQIGRTIFIIYVGNAAGNSSTTGFTITGPVASRNSDNGLLNALTDNSVVATTIGAILTTADSRVYTLYKDTNSGAWTSANTKKVDFKLQYEVGPAASFIN